MSSSVVGAAAVVDTSNVLYPTGNILLCLRKPKGKIRVLLQYFPNSKAIWDPYGYHTYGTPIWVPYGIHMCIPYGIYVYIPYGIHIVSTP